MKILLISPKSKSSTEKSKKLIFKLRIHPTLTLKQLASVTPDKHNMKLIDERYENLDFNLNFDLVGISCMTPEANRAYKISDKFREKGIPVILGGWHPSVLPKEAKLHADSVVVGEAEYLWPRLLKDFEGGNLKQFYKQNEAVNLGQIRPIKRKPENYVSFTDAVQSSRGCPFRCEFCAISNNEYGKLYRKRKVEDVVDELKSIKQKYIYFFDPSLTIDLDYTKKLFREMKGLNKEFKCFGNLDSLAKDDELLKLASEAGCRIWFVGMESVSQKTLDFLGKNNSIKDYKSLIGKIHDYNMSIFASFIFGFDTDTIDVFDKTIENVFDLDIDEANFGILTPYPGTPLFDRLEKERRIITKDWSKYTENNVVFQPKNMTPNELMDGTIRVRRAINSFSGIFKRKVKSKRVSCKVLSQTFLSA